MRKSFSQSNMLSDAEHQNDWWEELTIAQKKQILAGLEDADEGKLMDSKKFWKELNNE